MRGGVSNPSANPSSLYPFSPRAWRCFLPYLHLRFFCKVFSTCVEVFLAGRNLVYEDSGFLHVRGGVSLSAVYAHPIVRFSPRAWRCFFREGIFRSIFIVFSTCVEVFLSENVVLMEDEGFLHVRGGVSPLCNAVFAPHVFSPRAWRCFCTTPRKAICRNVFSTCVEVFPRVRMVGLDRMSFLHVRGGVSTTTVSDCPIKAFSPRAWRCFQNPARSQADRGVFSTCVEVFLSSKATLLISESFLHVRGGVSTDRTGLANAGMFSPRAWRCFYISLKMN